EPVDNYISDQPTDHSVAAPAPSVDGVLPPGVQPQPAPASHNLSSQTVAASTPIPVDVNDTAGDYIMTAPPLHSAPADIPEAEHAIEPAYEGLESEPVEHVAEAYHEPAPVELPISVSESALAIETTP